MSFRNLACSLNAYLPLLVAVSVSGCSVLRQRDYEPLNKQSNALQPNELSDSEILTQKKRRILHFKLAKDDGVVDTDTELNRPCDCGVAGAFVRVVLRHDDPSAGYDYLDRHNLTYSNDIHSLPPYFVGRVDVSVPSFTERQWAYRLRATGLFRKVGLACEDCGGTNETEYAYKQIFGTEQGWAARKLLCKKLVSDGLASRVSHSKEFLHCRYTPVTPSDSSSYRHTFSIIGPSNELVLKNSLMWEKVDCEIDFYDDSPWTSSLNRRTVGVYLEVKRLFAVKSPAVEEPSSERFEKDSSTRLEDSEYQKTSDFAARMIAKIFPFEPVAKP